MRQFESLRRYSSEYVQIFFNIMSLSLHFNSYPIFHSFKPALNGGIPGFLRKQVQVDFSRCI